MAEQTNGREVFQVVGILNWAFLAQPYVSKKYPLQGPKFKTQVLLEPNDPQIAGIKERQRRLAAATWGDSSQTALLRLQAQDKLALHDGNLQEDEHSKGKLFIKASHKSQPTIVATLSGPMLQAAIAEAPNAEWAKKIAASGAAQGNVPIAPGHVFFPYSGCKAAVMVEMYVYNKESFVFQLQGVQFLAHGKAFGGGGNGGRVAQVNEFGINPLDADGAIPMTQADLGAASGLF